MAILLILATALVYQQVWRAGFIWDDDAHLTKNPCIVGPLGFSGIWTTSAATYYPLTLTTFWIQHWLWGLNPLPYHVVNVLVHAACGVLLWQVLRLLGIPGSWFAAMLWVLHPVQVESAAWITELKNTQSCFFYLLAIVFFLGWLNVRDPRRPRKNWRYGVALLCALLAILSKSATVMLPVALALCWWWMEGRWRWRNLAWLSPFLIISLAASAWTIWEQKYHSGALGQEWDHTLPERAVLAGKVIWFYLGKLLWPHPLIFIYPRWRIDAADPIAWVPLITVVAGLAVLWWSRARWGRAPLFAMAYFVASLLPVLGFFNVYFFRYSFVGDHLQYIASIGPLVLGAAAVTSGFRKLASGKCFLQPVVCGALMLLLGLLSWRQCALYKDENTLWRTTVSLNPNAWIAHNNLGRIDHVDEAIGHYAKALEINPKFAEGHNNLAAAFMQIDRVAEALPHFQTALKIDPKYADAYYNLANAYLRIGRVQDAIGHFRSGLTIKPNDADAHYNLGNALLQIGSGGDAIPHFQRALEINPADAEAHNNLAWVLATHPDVSRRNAGKAVELAERADALTAQKSLRACATLAAAYAEARRFDEAVNTAERGMQLARNPGDQPVADALRAQIELYRAGFPYRDNTQEARSSSPAR